jgi:hypothetical protein
MPPCPCPAPPSTLSPCGASPPPPTTLLSSCSAIKAIIEGPPFQLLEAAAEAVSGALLAHDRRVGAVQVQLLKPHVAVPGVVDALGE